MTPEHKQAISDAKRGKKQTPEHIAKRVAGMWNSGAYERLRQRCVERKGKPTGVKHTTDHRMKISTAMVGKQNSLGVKRPLEFRQHLSEYWKDNPNHNHWVDGKCAERKSKRAKEMSGLEYRLWRTSVFQRDSYTCVECGERGGKLCADHIKPYCLFPELRFNVDNGRTLCGACHKETDTFAGKMQRKIGNTVAMKDAVLPSN